MTLEQKIGAMLMLGWEGDTPVEDTTVCDKAREIVQEMEVGGIILMGRNIRHNDLSVTVNTINELQSMSKEPLLVNVDQEGGMVARFTEGVAVMPSNMAIGATRRADLAYKSAAVSAAELKAIGINYDFAPSIDVNNNPDNPIIGTRSYSEFPEVVGEFGAEAIRGFQDAGIIACAKHFPGHGDTAVDSHLALPSVPYGRERLDAIELKPYPNAIKAGVSTIMTTHIMFPELDPDLPSTLSNKIITGVLRSELGYDGVVVTDSMEMKAIADNWGVAEASVMAIEAGVDLVLIPHTLAYQREAREAIIKAVRDGRISEDRIDQSVARLTALKQRYNLNQRRYADPSALGQLLRKPEHLALQKEIAELSVTLVRNENNVVPLRPSADGKILVVGTHSTVNELAAAVREHFANVEAMQLTEEHDAALDQALAAASTVSAVIVPSCPHEPWRAPTDQALQTDLIKALQASGARLVVVAVREPYELRKFPDVGAYVCTYGYREGMMQAAAALIMGKIEPKGQLPVTIPLSLPEMG